MRKNGKPKLSTKRMADKAYDALKAAVRDVIEEHRRLNMPLVVGQNGKVVYLSADTLSPVAHEPRSKYAAKKKK